MSTLVNSKAWQALLKHYPSVKDQHMRQWFETDPRREQRFNVSAAGWYLDYSKNRITDETLELLLDLARQAGVESLRDRMFGGDKINHTEERAVLHTALRNFSGKPVMAGGQDVMPMVSAERRRLRDFSEAVRGGKWRGYGGQQITDIVNIGIGGSDLGPHMVCDALQPYAQRGLKTHFVSNVDGYHIHHILESCRPETTLFIISSKTFSTQETLNNARAARAWFLENGGPEGSIDKHFVAVTSNNKLAAEFGISPAAQFSMWDWVGGRYSLWSAIGLPIAISIGMDRFEELLRGAHAMDEHFRTAPLKSNMPVILALLGVWYNNFFGYESFAILPYIQQLELLPNYLQQTDMESNGKRIDREGREVDYETGPILWGGVGTNAQHAFFQLLHQGTKIIPSDFIIARQGHGPYSQQQRMLVANAVAQMETLMTGKTAAEARREMSALPAGRQEFLAPYKEFAGNKPSNALLTEKLTPETLGALIALYEHKVFVQGAVWNINSYDQWGVEYGKQVAQTVLQALESGTAGGPVSSSTRSLVERLK
ncbi:MAG TPA: glucose-6-phosphate isomerase [Gammaproteobacteria bacterium]|nr:glucose-6-phosphate isomerase [Gammaproteobacteria bacterium]